MTPEIKSLVEGAFSRILRHEMFLLGVDHAEKIHAKKKSIALIFNWTMFGLFAGATAVCVVTDDHSLKTLMKIFQFYVVVRWAVLGHSFLTQKTLPPEMQEKDSSDEKVPLRRIK